MRLHALGLLGLLGLACANNALEPRPEERHTPKKCTAGYTVTVAPSSVSLAVDSSATLTATVTTPCGVPASTSMTWTVRNSAVVAPIGATTKAALVTGIASGSSYVVATSGGGGADSALITVTGSAACVSTDTNMCPGDDVAAKVQAASTGATFTFGSGVYRQQKIVPKNNQTFTGSGAVLDGGRVLTGWTASGSNFFVGGQTQGNGASGAGSCESGFPRCLYPEQLWRDGVLQTPVDALANLGTGKWFFDYTADRIYVRDNPSGHTIETSVSPFAFKSSASGVTITGFTVKHYAPSGNGVGAIVAQGNNWTISGNTVVDNAGAGIQVFGNLSGGTIADNTMSRNGQYGLSISSGCPTCLVSNYSVLRNRLDSNNVAHWNRGFGAGAMKLTRTDSLIFTGNRAERNIGNGPWWDNDNLHVVANADTAQFNAGTGFFCEISFGCKITNSVSIGNGTDPTDSFQNGAGMLCSATSDCEFAGNTVSGNLYGILLLQQDRGSSAQYGERLVINANIHDNTVTMDAGTSGFKGTFQSTDYNFNRNNRFVHNSYTVSGAANYFSSNGSNVSDAAWKALPQDATGTITRVP